MDVSYTILPGAFEAEAAQMESEEASKIMKELVKLTKDGFGATQTALDLAIETKSRISRMCLLIARSGAPNAVMIFKHGLGTIKELDKVILNIKRAMEES